MITVQAIRYAADTTAWHDLATRLGLRPLPAGDQDWAEFAGDGVLAIHVAGPDRGDGEVDLHLLVDDLPGAADRIRASGVEVVESELEGVGAMLLITVGTVTISVSAGAHPEHGPLALQPIWFTDQIEPARRVLEAIGLQPRIAANGGGWIDFTADGGGIVALHSVSGADTTDRPTIGLSFEHHDVDALAVEIEERGLSTAVVDESYNRSLIAGSAPGPQAWVNGSQHDLYGYHRVE